MSVYRNITKPTVVWSGPMVSQPGRLVRVVALPVVGEIKLKVEMSVDKDAMGERVWCDPTWTGDVIETLAHVIATNSNGRQG